MPTTSAATDTTVAAAIAAAEAVHGNSTNGPARRIKRGATVFADVPDEAPEAGQIASDSAKAGELRRFLLTGLPAAQAFTIRPGRDTMVVGTQGTQLLIPAGNWQLSAVDAGADVKLELREFYSRTDMVLAGLSTAAGPELLETAGMLHLTATANGRPVQLRPGAFVHLRMPAARYQESMQLFEGEVQGPDHHVNWRLPAEPDSAADVTLAAGKPRTRKKRMAARRAAPIDSMKVPRPQPQWPEYKQFDKELLAQFRSLTTGQHWRRNRHSSQGEKDALDRLSQAYSQRIIRRTQADFTVDSAGALLQPKLYPGTDPELGTLLATALRKLKSWEPAKTPVMRNKRGLGFERAAATSQVQLLISKTGHVFIDQQPWALARASRPRAIRFKYELDSLWADSGFRRRYRHELDSIADSKRPPENWAQSELMRLRIRFTDTAKTAVARQGAYNELSTQRLSWVNCDRFVSTDGTISYQVRRPDQTVVKLLFKKEQSIVTDDFMSQGTMAQFHSAPLRQPVTIVALRREKGVVYLALHETTITSEPFTDLRFHPVTIAELRAELAAKL